MKRTIAAAALAALSLCIMAVPAAAQAPQSDEDIVVVAERLREMVREFVGEVAVAPSSERQMARWDRKICPLVAGLPARQMQYMADRIAQRAHQVRLEPEGAGCKANILIFVTPDASRFAEGIVDEYRELVAYYSTNGVSTLGRGPLEDFTTSSAPVRWWHVNQTVSADGQQLADDTGNGGMRVVRSGQPPGRLRRGTRQDFLRVLIIVDARQAQGLQFQALADYVAMVSLAQLDPAGETTDIPSILNLFNDNQSGRPAQAAMTEWDEAYLDGLYNARRTAPREVWQQRDITRRMVDSLGPGLMPSTQE
ncbi:MAG: hypothetical protein AB7H66_08975 [Hyphomonadaceae bacterium]